MHKRDNYKKKKTQLRLYLIADKDLVLENGDDGLVGSRGLGDHFNAVISLSAMLNQSIGPIAYIRK